MKYCSKCGNQLFDEAVICPKCGCPVVDEETMSVRSDVDKNRLVFSVVGLLLFLISIILYVAPFVTVDVGLFTKNISGFQIAFDSSGNRNGVVLLFSLFMSFAGFVGLLISTFAPQWSIVGINPQQKTTGDFFQKAIIGQYLIFGLLGFISFMINLFSVEIASYSDIASANLGFGSITSGICSIFAWVVYAAGNSVWLQKKAEESKMEFETLTVEEKNEILEKENEMKSKTEKNIKTVLKVWLIAMGVLVFIAFIIIQVIIKFF